MTRKVEAISWERKSDAIYTDFEGTPVSKITLCLDDGSWSVTPVEEMFKDIAQTFSSLKAAEYYSLCIALEMESLGFFK